MHKLKKPCLTVLFLFISWISQSQSLETVKLLSQAENVMFSNPGEALTISEHILKSENISAKEETKSNYIAAVSYYVMGEFDKSLNKSFDSMNLSDDSGDLEHGIKSRLLINRIMEALHLDTKFEISEKTIGFTEEVFLGEDLLRKAYSSLISENTDSAVYYAKKAESFRKEGSSGYLDLIYKIFEGELAFNNKKLDSSYYHYQSALKLNEVFENPFLQYEINQRLADNYLAMDSLGRFSETGELLKELDIKITAGENTSLNTAHMLTVSNLDKELIEKNKRLKIIFWVVLFSVVSAAVLKLIFHIRNRNKLKVYGKLVDYLNPKEEKKEISLPTPEVPAEEARTEEIKESELQILKGLEKFEESGKFTKKDMSLGMLTAELNTNTKYLSEVINRYKSKNFNAYINGLRIDYITSRLKNDPKYLNYKMSYLAEESGFSSHSTFTTVFKSIVGVSPITFVGIIKEELEKKKEV